MEWFKKKMRVFLFVCLLFAEFNLQMQQNSD